MKRILLFTGAFAAITGTALLTGCVVAEPSRVVTVSEGVYAPGTVIRTLPPGYTVRRYDNVDYYVVNDVWYRRGARGYAVVESPLGPGRVTTYRVGHVTTTLPVGYTVRRHRGRDYYVAGDTWYRPHRRGYVVVRTPR